MDYSKTGTYKLTFSIPKYKVRIQNIGISSNIKMESIGLTFPFGISTTLKPQQRDSEIAKEVIVKLIDRRILNSKECCASCIKQSVDSLKKIKSDLIGIKVRLSNRINEPLFYYVDYIVISINAFNDFIERYENDIEQNKVYYFDALEKIRNHIANCMYEISKIGHYVISKEHYAFKSGSLTWHDSDYDEIQNNPIDLRV